MGVRKRYDEAHGEYGRESEREVASWLNHKYPGQIHRLPENKYGIDIGDGKGEIRVEVERRADAWDGDTFRFKTLHVPDRRARPGERWFLVQTNHRITRAYVIFWYSLLEARIKEVPNRCVESGEEMFDIPIDEGLLVDLTVRNSKSLEQMNCERIRQLLANTKNDERGRAKKRVVLGAEPPFGMLYDEWKKLKLDVDAPVVQQMLFSSPPRFSEPYA